MMKQKQNKNKMEKTELRMMKLIEDKNDIKTKKCNLNRWQRSINHTIIMIKQLSNLKQIKG